MFRIGYTWPGETFFRLSTPSAKRKHFTTEDFSSSALYDRVVRILPGLKAMYESVEEFQMICFGAYCSEHRFLKRSLRSQSATGTVAGMDFIEKLGRNEEDKIEKWAFYINVDETKLWSEKGQHGIKYVTIVPMIKEKGTLKETNNNLWILSSRYQITRIEESDKVKVTLIGKVDKERQLKVGDKVVLIPKPPDDEKKAISTAIKKWDSFITSRNKPKIPCIVHSSKFCKDTIWVENLERFNVMYVTLIVDSLQIFDSLSYRLTDSYIGLQTRIPECFNVLTGRIVGMENHDAGRLHLQVVFVLKNHINFTVGCNLELSLWMISSNKFALRNKEGFIADENPDVDFYDTTLEDTDDHDFQEDEYKPLESGYEPTNFIDIFVEKSVCKQFPDDIEWILCHWRDKPDNDLSLLDYLLYPSSAIKHDNIIVHEPCYYDQNEVKTKKIRASLNLSQVIKNFAVEYSIVYRRNFPTLTV